MAQKKNQKGKGKGKGSSTKKSGAVQKFKPSMKMAVPVAVTTGVVGAGYTAGRISRAIANYAAASKSLGVRTMISGTISLLFAMGFAALATMGKSGSRSTGAKVFKLTGATALATALAPYLGKYVDKAEQKAMEVYAKITNKALPAPAVDVNQAPAGAPMATGQVINMHTAVPKFARPAVGMGGPSIPERQRRTSLSGRRG